MMGSGGMIVMDDKTCMVDLAKYFLNFLRDESCGKCVSCREGTQRMYEIVSKITDGLGTMADIALLEELAVAVKDAWLCGLGQTAANPVLSTLSYFRAEYERHVLEKRCPAMVCKEIVSAPCQYICPVDQEASSTSASSPRKNTRRPSRSSARTIPCRRSAAGSAAGPANRSAGPARSASPSPSGP